VVLKTSADVLAGEDYAVELMVCIVELSRLVASCVRHLSNTQLVWLDGSHSRRIDVTTSLNHHPVSRFPVCCLPHLPRTEPLGTNGKVLLQAECHPINNVKAVITRAKMFF